MKIYFREKISMPKKTEGGPFGIFQHPFCRKTSKKCRGTLWGKNVPQCRKKIERGDALVLPGMVCYAEKQGNPFWSSSLGQMVQFDTIIFGRTFKSYFGQFVCIEKVTIIVAFHFRKRRLKILERQKIEIIVQQPTKTKTYYKYNIKKFSIFSVLTISS